MIKIKISHSAELDEGRVDDIKKKYPGQDDLVDEFASNPEDPNSAPGNNKYLDWMMKHADEASPEEMLSTIKKFDKYISQFKQKDINSYGTFDEFYDVVDNMEIPTKELERVGTHKIYEDDEFSITRPLNKEASCKLGAKSKWCIAATKSKNYFVGHAKKGYVHYILRIKNLPDTDNSHIFAYSFVKNKSDTPSLEINDASNKLVNRKYVADVIGEEKENKFYDIMLAEYNKNIPSDIPEENPMYEKLKELDGNYYSPRESKELASKYIEKIFYDEDIHQFRTEPRYVKKQFKNLINLNTHFGNLYLHSALESYHYGDEVAKLAKQYIKGPLKDKLLANINSKSSSANEQLNESRIIKIKFNRK